MTSSSVISDAQAREIAANWGGVFAPLGHSGAIDAVTLKAARAEAPEDCPDPCERCQLNAYILVHGRRGPVDSWGQS